MKSQVQTWELSVDAAIGQSVDGVFMIDQDRQLVYFSDGCERITGIDRSYVLGTSCMCFQLTNCKDEQGRSLAGVLCPAAKIINGEIPYYLQRMTVEHQDGTRIRVETTYSPIRDERREITGVVGVMRDISDRAEVDESLSNMENGTGCADTDTMESSGATPRDGNGESTIDPTLGKLDRILNGLERKEILQALKQSNGQRTLAARALGISRSRLYRRMDALGIDVHKHD